ncbi:right-handed parallel beta-helix repeat-containing protein [Planctomycetota bacterium]
MKTQQMSLRLSWNAFLVLLVLAFFAVQSDSWAADIFVSVDGDAQADGSLAKPYGSLQEAVDALRALRQAGNTEPAKIILREGRHQLNQTLVLGLADGSPADAKTLDLPKYGAGESSGPAYLTFAAYPGETPVLSAGLPVTGWKRLTSAPAALPAQAVSKVWVADIPTGLERFYTLYDAKGRLNRARGDGFLPTQNGNNSTLYFPAGALKDWDNLEDVDIQVRPGVAYEINMLPLESVDEAAGVATTRVSAAGRMGSLPPYLIELMGDNAASVWVENILEELDEPGEWVVNTQTRKIYLWPANPAADGSPQGILAPTTSELICVEGSIDFAGPTDTPVRGIAFTGLTFSHADRWAWTSNEEVSGWGLQHAWEMFDKPTALLRFRGAEDCRVTACRFINSGGTGVRLDLHAQRNRISDSEFAHLGEAGILLVGYGVGTKDVNKNNDIINNHVHHFSEITWQSPGFWAWQSGHNRIAHNEFSHSGYNAVVISTRSAGGKTRPQAVAQENGGRGRGDAQARGGNREQGGAQARGGAQRQGGNQEQGATQARGGGGNRRGGYESWKLREKTLHSRHNLFEYNEISHAVQLLSDGNGIYVSGTGTGNILRYNYLHDNLAKQFPAPIRCDDDQHETLIYGNVLYNNGGHAAGIASKGVNDIINNFIVNPERVPRNGYISFEWAPVVGSKVQRNVIISHPEGGKAQSERLRREQTSGGPKLESTEMDKNLYYHPTDSHWMDEHLLKLQAAGKEKASLFGDPLFVDPENGDFSFRPGSPAFALGIEPLDVSKMGLKKVEKEVK